MRINFAERGGRRRQAGACQGDQQSYAEFSPTDDKGFYLGLVLLLHLLAEERGGGLRELYLCFGRDPYAVALEHDDRAGDVARGDDRVDDRGGMIEPLYRLYLVDRARMRAV